MAFKTEVKLAFTTNFSAPVLTRIVNAFASAYGYQTTINGLPNPQTKADFAVDQIGNYIQQIALAEEQKAANAAVVPPVIVPMN